MGQGRNSALDSLRGIAAVFVIFYHAILFVSPSGVSVLTPPVQDLSTLYEQLQKVLLTLVNGHNAVVLFFVLSGFVLMLSVERDLKRGEWSWWSFTVRRFMRLFPALVAALLFCFAVGLIGVKLGSTAPFLHAAADPKLVLQNMLLWKIGVQGATWTIQVETIVVPFLLAGFWMSRRFGIAGIAACLAVAFQELRSPRLTEFSPELTHSLFAFYAGMLAAKLPLDRFGVSRYASKVSVSLLAVSAYVFPSLFVSLHSRLLLIAQVLASAGLILCIYWAPTGKFSQALNNRRLVKVGRISYSLYLLNVPIMWATYLAFAHIGWIEQESVLVGVLLGALTTAITIPLADVAERAIEAPCNVLGKRLTSRQISPTTGHGEVASEIVPVWGPRWRLLSSEQLAPH